MLGNTLRLNFCYLKIFHPRYHTKIIGHILKLSKRTINHNENVDQMKNRSHRYNINRPSSRHGHKYRRYRKRLSMMMLICIKQHLSNSWSSIHEKQSNTEAELKKCVAYKKSVKAIILWSLDIFLIFPNFLRSEVLSPSATREVTRIYHG